MKRKWAVNASQLTPAQKTAITLPPDGCYAVTGPAGSGKTNVLLLRAKFLAKSRPGSSVLCLVFTQALRDFVRRGMQEYGLGEGTVDTFHGWGRKQLAGTGRADHTFDDYPLALAGLLDRGALPRFDYLLVDEAQDFDATVVGLLFSLSDNVTVCFDRNQSIFQPDDGLGEGIYPPVFAGYKYRIDQLVELPESFRVPSGVAEVASRILPESDLAAKTRAGGASSSPVFARFESREEELGYIARRITDLAVEDPDYTFAVLQKTNRDSLGTTYRGLRRAGVHALETTGRENGRPLSPCDFGSVAPKLVTCHSAKGLEFDVVFVAGATPSQFTNSPKDRNLAYVAVTRTRVVLHVTGSPAVAGLFCPPEEACGVERNDIELDELF